MLIPIFMTVALIVIQPLAFANIQQGHDEAVIASFIAKQARRQHGEEYPDARKVLEGDLDKDGTAETVVLYTIEGQGGSNNYIQYLAVFARINGNLSPVTYTIVGGKSRRSIELTSVENNMINLDTLAYGPKDPSCCPSVKRKVHYALVGRTLQEQKSVTTSKMK